MEALFKHRFFIKPSYIWLLLWMFNGLELLCLVTGFYRLLQGFFSFVMSTRLFMLGKVQLQAFKEKHMRKVYLDES